MNDELAQLKERCERLQLLYQVSNVIHSSLDPQEALQLILREAVRLMHASSGSVVLVNPTTGFLEIEAAQGLPAQAARLKLRIGEGITGWVARTGKPARVGNVHEDPRYVLLNPKVKSELAVPLEVEGEIRGVINVDSARFNAFDVTDQELLEALAIQAAHVIQNTWLYEQIRKKARMFETLASVSQTINSALNLDDALRAITREAAMLMGVKMCSLLLLDPASEWLELRAHYGAGAAYINKPKVSAAESLLGVVVRRRKPLQVENVQTSVRYQQVDVAREEGLVALLSVPLLFKGEALGALNVYTGKPHNFSNEEIQLLSALAELSAIAIEKARLYERIVDAEEQLRQNERLSALGLLAAEVAHEIRNPLTVIKMLFHSLDLRFPAADPRARDVEIISAKMELLNCTVERILSFARKVEPKLGPVSLNDLVEDLVLLTRHKMQGQRVELFKRLAPDLPPIQGDVAQLEQAFLNLVLNAMQAMPNGGRLTITTRLATSSTGKKQATAAVIEFTDTGEGMSDAQQERAFNTLLNTTKPGGTGLGLAIVRRVVETHHGKLELKSKAGRGTTLRLLFPV